MRKTLTAILASSLYLFSLPPLEAHPSKPADKPTVDLHCLKEELPSIKEQGIFDGYNVHHIGLVTFPDCKFNNGKGLDAISRKLQSYDLRDKIIVLYGSTDKRSAKKCPSMNGEYLSGYRAISTLIDLEKRLGEHLHTAHIDIIAGGNRLNRRAADIYLLEKRIIEDVRNPFE